MLQISVYTGAVGSESRRGRWAIPTMALHIRIQQVSGDDTLREILETDLLAHVGASRLKTFQTISASFQISEYRTLSRKQKFGHLPRTTIGQSPTVGS